ncbi:MAG: right-handed parallel beta-helix repeat-containing protein [Candidatus Omnitrophota bacterium]
MFPCQHRFFPLGMVLFLGFAAVFSVPALADVTIYISPLGYDGWSGTLPMPGDNDGPVATPLGARNAIRALKAKGLAEGKITVYLREGTYRLSEPIQFTAEDSGIDGAPIVFAAYPGEKPVITGGRRITGWTAAELDGKTVWRADLPIVKRGKWWFRELFVNGERRPRTRLPETDYYEFTGLIDMKSKPSWSDGNRAAFFADEEIKPWKNLQDVEIVALTRWIESRSPIAGVDIEKKIVTFAKQSTFRLENTKESGHFAQYYIENVFEALNQPGQWHLDRQEGVLYYLPKEGETIETIQAEAPAVTQLLRASGSRNLEFRNLRFRCAEWEYPADRAGSVQAAMEVPGALYFEQTQNCVISNCVIEQVGTYGLELGSGCKNTWIHHCSIHDLGGGGIKVGHGSSASVVEDNEIAQGGRIYHSAIGVWVGDSGENKILHNRIYDFFYTGISVGWSWGYNPTHTQNNEIAYNLIYQIGKGVLSDLGAIYTLGLSDGSRIHHNLIHDIQAYSYGGWGIYLDEGTTHMLVENNIVYNTKTGGFHLHYGKENVIRNNIFALAQIGQIIRSRNEEHKSFDFINNIVYFTEGPLLGSNWDNNRYFMNKNLYWNPNKPDIEFPGGTFEQWKARGHDVDSQIADPLLADPVSGDFTLKPDSPALKLGFQPINLQFAGPRPVAKIEFRLAELEPIAGLTETTISGTDRKAYLYDKVELSNVDLENARWLDAPSPQIEAVFTVVGKDRFANLMQKNLNKPLAILLDGKALSIPIVWAPIAGERLVIKGAYSKEEGDRFIETINKQ